MYTGTGGVPVGGLARRSLFAWYFKDLNLLRPRNPLTVILVAAFLFLVWNYSQPVLLAFAVAYVGSGIAIRIGGILRRTYRRLHPAEASS